MNHLHEETIAAYTGPRPDVESLIVGNPATVLDVGCATGVLGEALRSRGAHVTGVELDPALAGIAESRLDRCIQDDAASAVAKLAVSGERFDVVIFADILEHLVDPESVITAAGELLVDDGQCIVSLPNVRFYTTFTSLVFHGRWPRRERGVHDKTHLRWFTDRDAEDMFQKAGLRVEKRITHYRLLYRPHRFARLLKFIAFRPIRPFIAYQYVWRLRPAVD